MKRHIIKIDENKCVGCSLCVNACTQDALKMVDGKAKLVDESYCDGLGVCLPQCPVDAITITDTDASTFNEAQNNIKLKEGNQTSALNQWPVQLHLLRESASFFENSNLAIIADCVAYANANTHQNLIANKSIAIACPKLDDTSSYTQKLANIMKLNNIKTVTVAIMEVPCCTKLNMIAKEAIRLSGKDIPLREVTIGLNGDVL